MHFHFCTYCCLLGKTFEREMLSRSTGLINKPRVMPLLHNNVSDGWLIIFLQLLASLSHGIKLLCQNGEELSFTHSIPVHDKFLWLPSLNKEQEFNG